MHHSHQGAVGHLAVGLGSPEGPGSSPLGLRPAWLGAPTFHPSSFIPSSVGAAEPELELIESHIRARGRELKAALRYFITCLTTRLFKSTAGILFSSLQRLLKPFGHSPAGKLS